MYSWIARRFTGYIKQSGNIHEETMKRSRKNVEKCWISNEMFDCCVCNFKLAHSCGMWFRDPSLLGVSSKPADSVKVLGLFNLAVQISSDSEVFKKLLKGLNVGIYFKQSMQICFVVEICSKTCRVLQKRISICSCMIGPAISIYVTLKSDE